MKTIDTYLVKRNGYVIWLGINIPKKEDDELIEIRKVLLAKNGKTLFCKASEEYVGDSYWLRNGDVKENYEERDIPEPENQPEEQQ